MKKENYILIQGFMVTDLKLKGNELLAYAIIYGFSQEEGQTFRGSLSYLEKWLNASKQTVINTLKSLVEKGHEPAAGLYADCAIGRGLFLRHDRDHSGANPSRDCAAGLPQLSFRKMYGNSWHVGNSVV